MRIFAAAAMLMAATGAEAANFDFLAAPQIDLNRVYRVDKAIKLAATTQTETYLKCTTADIIGKMATRHGLRTAVSIGADAAQEHVFQSSTDLAFLDALCARSGTVWWVEPEGTQITISGALKMLGFPFTLRMKYLIISSATSMSAMTPSRLGRIASTLPGDASPESDAVSVAGVEFLYPAQ